ncbi:MAG: hypothetical protein MJ193_04655 [Clostridia bacterium]|nr:hypothetical protein [Clostridia bacterium]
MKKIAKTLIISILLVSIIAVSLLCFTACDEVQEGYTVPETVKVYLSPLETSVNGLPIGLLFSKDSYIEFTPEGNATIKLFLADFETLLKNPTVSGLLSGLDVDFSTITKLSLGETVIEQYVKVMFPGFDIHNFEDSLHMVFASLGGTVEGFDFVNNELLKKLDANLKDDSSPTLLPADFTLEDLAGLPSDISITLNAPYCFVDNKGLVMNDNGGYDEQTFISPRFGVHDPDTTPMFTMSYFPEVKEDNVPETVTYINFMLGLTLTFVNPIA